jgi:fumarate hydratase, class II
VAIIHALAMFKRPAAEVNRDLGLLPADLCTAIGAAAREIELPLRVWQTWSGTQTNMNVNEVIANRANEILVAARGAKQPVHPNDRANPNDPSSTDYRRFRPKAGVSHVRQTISCPTYRGTASTHRRR